MLGLRPAAPGQGIRSRAAREGAEARPQESAPSLAEERRPGRQVPREPRTSDEQEFLREAARGALSRFKTVERHARLEGGELPTCGDRREAGGRPARLRVARGAASRLRRVLVARVRRGGRVRSSPAAGDGDPRRGELDDPMLSRPRAARDLAAHRPPAGRGRRWTVDPPRQGARPAPGPSSTRRGGSPAVPSCPTSGPTCVRSGETPGAVAAAVEATPAASRSSPSRATTRRGVAHVVPTMPRGRGLPSRRAARARVVLTQALIAAESVAPWRPR